MLTETFDKITLINGDCFDYMRTLPDNAFSLAVVDPPYSKANGNVERTGGTWAAKYGTSIRDWDIAPSDEYFKELFRVSRNQIIWGGAIISVCPLRGASLYGASCQSPKTLLWQWRNMRGLLSTLTQRFLSAHRKVTQKNLALIHAKNPLRFTHGYCRTTPKRATKSLIRTLEAEAVQSRLTISVLSSLA